MSKRSFETGSTSGFRAATSKFTVSLGRRTHFGATLAFIGLLLGVGIVHSMRSTVPNRTAPTRIAALTSHDSIHSTSPLQTIALPTKDQEAAKDKDVVRATESSANAPYDVAGIERQVRANWIKAHPAQARAAVKGDSYTEVAHLVDRSDWESLSATHRGMIRKMVADSRAGRVSAMLCFAPGTDVRTVRAFDSVSSKLEFFRAGTYWTNTASGPHNVGERMTLSWSVVPDGTIVPNGTATAPSNLRARLNGIYGNEATWRAVFRQVFDRFAQLSGITYIEETADDGAGSPDAPGVLGVRGDVRIGGARIDGNFNVLAFNFFPDLGDMVIDTADSFYNNTGGNSLGLRNVLAHEHGHGLAFSHTCPINQTKLMEPTITYNFDGPQADELQNLQRGYADPNEPNNTQSTATDLGTLGNGSLSRTNISIQNAGDQDYFRLNTSAAKLLSARVTPLGGTYLEGPQNPDGSCTPGAPFEAGAQRNLKLAVYDRNGTELALADANGAGEIETLSNVLLNTGAGPFAVRVFGDTADRIQLYSIELVLVDGGPLLDLNGPPTGTGFNATFTEDAGPVAIVDAGALTVGNTGNANLASATITVSNRPDGDAELLNVTPSGAITAANISYASGVLTITADASIADYQAVLRSATYNNLSQNPNVATRTINFAISDNRSNSGRATSTVQVVGVNDAPTATSQNVTTAEDTAVPITLLANDVDNSGLTYSIVSSPTRGVLSGSGANRVYTPNPNFSGSDSFTFKVNDGAVDSNIATVSITVTAVNDAPVNRVPTAQNTAVGSPLIFSTGTGNIISISDADAGSGALEVALSVSNGTLTLNGTTGLSFSQGDGSDDVAMTFRGTLSDINAALEGLIYTPAPIEAGFSNTDNLIINTNDLGNTGGPAQSARDSVAIVVGNPVFAFIDDAAPVAEGNSGQANVATFRIRLARLSSQEVRVDYQTQSGTATEGSDFVRTSGTVVFSPNQTNKTITVPYIGDTVVESNETFTVRLSNPQNASLSAQSFVATGTITDDDAAVLALSIAPTTFSETAGANAARGTVSRNTTTGVPLTVNLQSAVNSKVTVPDSVTIPAGQTSATFPLNAVDDKVVNNDLQVAITASSNGFAAATVNVTVTNDDVPPPPNQAPTANPQNLSTDEDTSIALTLSGSDPEGSALTFRITGAPLYRPTGSVNFSPAFEGTLNQNNQNVVFTPPQDFNGEVRFSFVASDGEDDSTPAQITIQVLGVNDAPIARDDKIRFVLQNSNSAPLAITLRASDVDNDALTYFVGTDLPGDSSESGRSIGPIYGTLSGTAPNLIYTPRAGYRGRDVFTFYVSDGKAFSQRARIDILVTGSRGVVAANDSYTLDLNDTNEAGQTPAQADGITFRDGTFRIAAPGVIANDRDPANGNLIVRLARTTRNGRLALRSDGSFDYTPNAGFVGTDFFAYTVGTPISQAQGRVRLIVRDRRGPELFFDAPADDIVTFQVSEIRGRVRDGNAGLKSISLLWRREADGKFWNGSRWVAGETLLPLTVQGDNWRYVGALPQPGDDPNVSLLDGDYALQVTAVDKSNNTNRVVNSITIDRNAPDAPATSPVRLSSGSATSTPNAITLNFTGALNAASASDATNYRVMIDGVSVRVPQATYANNVVTLSGVSFDAGQILDLQINGLRDAMGRRLPAINVRVLSR